MADYNITLSDSVTVINIPEGAVSSAYSVPLVGQNATTYGDDVAAGFLRHLENFSAATAPQLNAFLGNPAVLKGQLWFDSVNSVLNVNIGTTATPNFQQITATQKGATTNSMLRWDGTKWAEENQALLTSAGTFSLRDTGLSKTVSFSHSGSNFVMDGTSTVTDVTMQNFSGDFTVLSPSADTSGLSVEHDGTALAIRANGTSNAINVTATGTEAINLPATVKLNTAASTASRAGVNVAEGVAPSAPVDGDVWVTAAGEFFARLNGVSQNIAAAAGGTVTASTGADDRVAVFTTGTNIEGDANFTWDGSNLSATNIGGIAEGDLLDKSQNSEVITGTNWDFSGISNSSGQIAATTGTTLRILSTDNTDYVDFSHGSGASDGIFDITATATSQIHISGADVGLEFGSNLEFLNDTGANERITFRTDNATAGGSIGWRDSSNNLEAQIFYYAGLLNVGGSTLTNFRVSTSSDGEINVSDQVTFDGVQTALSTLCGGTWDAGVGGGVTSKMFVKDVDGVSRNIGWNETPTQNIGLGTYTLDNDDVANFLTHDGNLGSTLVECPNSSLIPIGATWILANDGTTAGTCTIAGAVGVTLYWLDGGGGASATTGTRTLAKQGICTIRKQSNTQYQIWGAGLT